MRSRRNFVIIAIVVAVILVLTVLLRGAVTQRTFVDEENIVFQSDFHLTGSHPSDLVAGGQTVLLDAESAVLGDATLLGDTLRASGKIAGDLTMLGGTLTVDPAAVVSGDVNLLGTDVTLGGKIDGTVHVTADRLTLLPGAQLSADADLCGDQIDDQRGVDVLISCRNEGFDVLSALVALRGTPVGNTTFGAHIDSLVVGGITLVGIILLAATSSLAVILFPHQISRVEEALRSRPRGFGGVGIAVYILGGGLFLLMIFVLAVLPPLGLLLVPVFLLLVLLIGILTLIGLITLALMLGDWLLRRVTHSGARTATPPLVSALVGSVAISLLLALIALLPFGFVISFGVLGLISSAGLGAALFTRAGTRSLHRSYFVTG